jgi:predicted amidohydrolase
MRQARLAIVTARLVTDPSPSPAEVLKRARDGMARVAPDRPDLVLLAELFANPPAATTVEAVRAAAQTVPGPISEELGALARAHNTYVAFGLLRRDGDRCFNSLVVLDRGGKPVWFYDKTTPMVEEMRDGGISPGAPPRVFAADFGRIGAAICFDINFLELAECYARQATELICFCSAFPGGRLLDVWALRYGFNILGCTWYPQNRVIDCTGATVGRTSDILRATTTVLNLNRRVVHMDGNLGKIERMRAAYAGDVLVEDLRQEAVCVITSLKPGLEVADLIREFEVEPLHAYFDRARRVRAANGGMAVPRREED